MIRPQDREPDQVGTINVLLVIILPILQMILVLVILSLLRICYLEMSKRRKNSHPKLLDVVSAAQERQSIIMLSPVEGEDEEATVSTKVTR